MHMVKQRKPHHNLAEYRTARALFLNAVRIAREGNVFFADMTVKELQQDAIGIRELLEA